MSSAFRDQLDQGVSMRFTQHIGIAEHCLEEIERIPAHIDSLERGDGVTQELMEIWARKWAKGWGDCWEQLREARQVVAGQGRDTAAFDAAFASAGDIYLETAEGKATRVGNTVYMKWRSTPTTSAHAAIAALRSAMPEVVATRQPDAPVDLQSTSSKVLGVVIVIALILVGVLVIYGTTRGKH
jgi:hypothetical protein